MKPQKHIRIREIANEPQPRPGAIQDKTDREIWQMFRNGHEGAFRYIYEQYVDHLFKYGVRFTVNRELIKDLIQDLFIELRNSRNLSDTDCIRFYLLRALRYKIIRTLKRQDRKNWLVRKHSMFNIRIEVSHEIKILNRQMEEENRQKIQYAISRLNNKQREAIYYFFYEDLSYAQIASLMGFSNVKSARNLIYKALDIIRKDFKL